ncbi:MAG: Trp family transcriptional regulator [Thermodesulfobacteriota bacterium]|nr:Trp family transcriptional regulator [Thermodesulfobacteriota bacterium]
MDKGDIHELAEVLSRIRDKELMARFLEELFTPAEIGTFSLRWELVSLLNKGTSQREISKRLGISLCKITRGSRELKKGGSALKEVIRRYTE